MAFPSPIRLNLQKLNDCLSNLRHSSRALLISTIYPLPLLFRYSALWIRRSTYRQQNNNRYPRVEYAQNYNSSKGTYFKGGYDADGNYFDID